MQNTLIFFVMHYVRWQASTPAHSAVIDLKLPEISDIWKHGNDEGAALTICDITTPVQGHTNDSKLKTIFPAKMSIYTLSHAWKVSKCATLSITRMPAKDSDPWI